MRIGLIVLLCVLNTGCALWRKDREEPVEPRRTEKAEPVLRPSEVLKPEVRGVASPTTDRFYLRGTYFMPSFTTDLRVDNTGSTVDGTELSGEEDLGLDDQGDQGRMEFMIRLAKRHQVRVDYFKLNRFSQVTLDEPINFGDFTFTPGTQFRSKLDWRMLTLTHTYSFFKFDRFEMGAGLGISIIEAQAQGGEPGTLRREEASEVGPFPTIAAMTSVRLTKRFSVNLRAQQFSHSQDEFSGKLADYHGDIQFRIKPNFAVGIGYTKIEANLEVIDADLPLLFNLDASGPEAFFRVSF